MANKSKPTPTFNISLEEFCRALDRYNKKARHLLLLRADDLCDRQRAYIPQRIFEVLKGAIPV